jgi:hypothetical protein
VATNLVVLQREFKIKRFKLTTRERSFLFFFLTGGKHSTLYISKRKFLTILYLGLETFPYSSSSSFPRSVVIFEVESSWPLRNSNFCGAWKSFFPCQIGTAAAARDAIS